MIDSYWTKLFWLMTKILMKLCVALWLSVTCNFPGWEWSSCFVSLRETKGIENIVSEVKLQFQSQFLFNYDVLFFYSTYVLAFSSKYVYWPRVNDLAVLGLGDPYNFQNIENAWKSFQNIGHCIFKEIL